MGGTGSGHKSVRAQESRRINIQKARAARKRAPLPWRSGIESRMIEQLVWQWSLEARGWGLEVGEKQQQVPHRHPATAAGWVRDDNVENSGEWLVTSGERRQQPKSSGQWTGVSGQKKRRPWAKLRVARFLGVSHTWVNKLVKKFEADPERMRRKMRAFAPASIDKLEKAREETHRQRELGWLRGPIRYRRVKVVIQGKRQKVVAATRVEQRRRQAEIESERTRLSQGYGAASEWPFDFAQGKQVTREFPRSKNEHGAPAKAIPYREIPAWATGLLLPGDAGTIPLRGPFVPQGKQARGPRPVPFAFRRRR
jgi:hypothetical protein